MVAFTRRRGTPTADLFGETSHYFSKVHSKSVFDIQKNTKLADKYDRAMSEDTESTEGTATDRRTLLGLAAMAGVPLFTGRATAATTGHMGETWESDQPLTMRTTAGFGGRALVVEGDGASSTSDSGSVPLEVTSTGINPSAYIYSEGGDAIRATAGYDSSDPAVYAISNGSGPAVEADGDLQVNGDFSATGTKNFVQTVDTADGPVDVAYTAVEADQAQTETTGVTRLDEGRVEIDLPDHFGLVTAEREELVVQLTPYEIDAPRLAVTERSPDRIVVEADEPADTEFSYTVRGVREGYEDKQVVTDAEESDSSAQPTDDEPIEPPAE